MLSVKSLFKVVTPLKKCYKINLDNNSLTKEKKNTCKNLILAYGKLFHKRKCNNIFVTSVLKIGVPL